MKSNEQGRRKLGKIHGGKPQICIELKINVLSESVKAMI